MRKTFLAPFLAVALASAGIGIAYAAVGPTGPGQIYEYFDDAGNHVGHSAIDCHGNIEKWGRATRRYETGYYICDPDV